MLQVSSVLLPPPHPQEQVDNMEEEELGQLLLDYAATYNNPKYNQDWDVVDSKFPELAKYDKNVLHDYVATYNNPEYGQDTTVVNAKFPELFGVVKKKDESVPQVPEPASLPLDGTDPSLDSPLPTEPSSGILESLSVRWARRTGQRPQSLHAVDGERGRHCCRAPSRGAARIHAAQRVQQGV